MEIDIKFGAEQFHFNLHQELIVNEGVINKEIKEQPNAYAFLAMLHKKLIRTKAEAEAQMEKKYAEIYKKYKEKTNPDTGRIYDKEYAHHIAIANPAYQAKLEKFIEASANVNDIEVCVKSFEQRANLIQTLSANIRKESY